MVQPIIEIKGISKKYKIQQYERYLTLRDKIADIFKNPFATLAGAAAGHRSGKDDFWALKDINFNVNKGEIVGIIGRNGAGKTTLLKILSRITYPTQGEVRIRGRVASLLEVGTGFHPELTGRENIYFNGSILGMKKKEIDKKLDEIIAFAEIEKFIDTPVKRYSSGMQVRLAFSVAAHLEPEILLVDEVLAVGDLLFQKKCLGKMGDVASKEGRTILFVSHNMEAIERLCSRTILLQEGRVVQDGSTSEVVKKYMQIGVEEKGEKIWEDVNKAPGNEVVRLHAVRIVDKNGKVATEFDVCDPVTLKLEYWVLQNGYSLDAIFYLYNERGQIILASMDNLDSPWKDTKRPGGSYRSVCHIPGDLLNDGQISLLAAVVTNPQRAHVILRDVLRFNVKDAMDPKGVRGNYPVEWPPAAVRPRLQWKVEHTGSDTATPGRIFQTRINTHDRECKKTN